MLLIPVALTALALVAVLLLGFCVVGIFSIRLFYVPAAIALVVSAVKSLRQGKPFVQAES